MQAVGDVNRAKLYYLRGKVGKKARVREVRGARGAAKRGAAEKTLDASAGVPATIVEPAEAEQLAAEPAETAEAPVEQPA